MIVLALNYWQGGLSATLINLQREAELLVTHLGDDYHQLISDKLDQIDMFLQTHGGVQKCYVDTGPLLERDHAAEAGIGWHGKSTC